MSTLKGHWEQVYTENRVDEVSWYQAVPEPSRRLIADLGLGGAARVLDVGGGASCLVDHLLNVGCSVGVMDLSGRSLALARARLGDRAGQVEWFEQDVRCFAPARRWDVWHDRAVFHFLTDPQDRARYRAAMMRTLPAGGYAVVGTFGPDGPERCSGLPTMRYDANELAGELGPDLSLRDSLLQVHRTPGGREQQFLYCRFERRLWPSR